MSAHRLDAHLHLWDRRRFVYPWMHDRRELPETSLPAASETAAIVVEAGIAPDQALAEVDWLGELAADSPRIRGIVAAVDFTAAHLPAMLDALRERPLVVGVRDNFEGRAPGDLDVRVSTTARTLLSGAEAALDSGLTVDLCVRFAQLGELDGFLSALVAHRGSAAGVVLDHLGKPLPADPGFAHADWVTMMTRLAAHPGLRVKLSGLPGQIPGIVSAEEAHRLAADFTAEVLTAFGARRTMFGSDHPVSTTAHGLHPRVWEEAVTAALSTAAGEDDRAAVLGGTAADFYSPRRP